MILFDISSAFHMCAHRIAKTFSNGEKINLQDYRKEFHLALFSMLDTHVRMFQKYGEPVICADNKELPSWRLNYYPMYKSGRNKFREGQTLFSYSDAYILFDEWLEAIEKFSGMKFIGVPEAEADDIILVLGELANANRLPTVILSPDKDFVQLQTEPYVEQYSWFTKKMVTPEEKTTQGDMKNWILEHICLGDHTDAVPRIVDFQEFKPGVKEYLLSKGMDVTPYEFSRTKYDPDEFEQFGGVFERPKFGPSSLRKMIKEAGGLKPLLESNETLMKNFKRNRILVMASGIPSNLRNKILQAFQVTPKEDIGELARVLDLDVQELPQFLQDKYITKSNLFEW